jgi:hypothetical protein
MMTDRELLLAKSMLAIAGLIAAIVVAMVPIVLINHIIG